MVEGYKNTEVGVIPSDWEVKPIADITTLMTNGFVGTVKSQYTDYDNGVLYIQGYNVEENSFNFNGIKRVKHEFHKQHLKSCLREGDLLTIQTGDIGVTTVVPKQLEGANCHALIITRFKKYLAEPKYYSYYFNYSVGRRRLKEIETGSTMKHINVGDMVQMLIPYPTKAEQTAIATALSDADALITQLEKLIAKKRMIKQGAMQELLKPKEGWEVKRLGDCLKQNPDYGINAKAVPFNESLPVYLRITDITEDGRYSRNNVVSVDSINSSKYYLEKGDLVFARTGASVGKTYLYRPRDGRLVFAGFLIRVRTNPLILNPEYFQFFTQTSNYWNWIIANSMRTGQPGINGNEYEELELITPPIEEQISIAETLSDMDTEIETLEKKLEKYKMLKQGMMQNLLTGRIRLV
jgi:type I restriction enzyme S subunit